MRLSAARLAAYQIESAVSGGRSDLPSAIAITRPWVPDERDRALASEIAIGVQRWRRALDYRIVAVCARPLDKLDAEILAILRISAYQLLYLSRVPASAVVDDAVRLARRARKSSAAGLVNGVLRAISRRRNQLGLPPRPVRPDDRAAALQYLGITLSHPDWLAARWYDRMGFTRTEQWMQFNNRRAQLALRVNRLKASPAEMEEALTACGVRLGRGRYAPDAFLVESGHPLRDAGSAEGSFVVQDEASQLVTLLAGEDPGVRLLDACASPGGKATAFAQALARRGGMVVACDVRDQRMALLRRAVRSTHAWNVRLVQADVSRSLPFASVFSCVVVDAPCSGLGTLRRDPDIRWSRQERQLAVLAARQGLMLRCAAAAVAPGGRLVYATCSSEPEENEHVVLGFLREVSGFRPVDARTVHPALPPAVIDARGNLRTEPDRHGLEAFFGAVLERTEGTGT